MAAREEVRLVVRAATSRETGLLAVAARGEEELVATAAMTATAATHT